MTIDWLEFTCPCCGGMSLVSIRQLSIAASALECECCGAAFGRRQRRAAADAAPPLDVARGFPRRSPAEAP
jgi:transcription elongation factor Elf1